MSSRPVNPSAETTRTVPRRSLIVLAAALLAACLFATLPGLATPAAANGILTAEEQDYVNRANALRAGLGLGPLTVDANLTDLSRRHTATMAATQNLHHTPDLVAGVTSTWQKLGENVGYGPSTPLVWNAFLNSPNHYANLVDPAYTHIGVGIVVDGRGVQWTTHRFMTAAAPAPVYVPPAPVIVQPAPAPIAQPAPAPAPPAKSVAPAAPKPAPVTAAPSAPVEGSAPAEATAPAEAPAPPLVVAPADPDRVSATLLALHEI